MPAPVEYITPVIEARAVEVLTLLADRGQHGAPSVPDLIVAATAGLAGLTVLYADKRLRRHNHCHGPAARTPERPVTRPPASWRSENRRCEFARPPGSATVLNARHPGRRG